MADTTSAGLFSGFSTCTGTFSCNTQDQWSYWRAALLFLMSEKVSFYTLKLDVLLRRTTRRNMKPRQQSWQHASTCSCLSEKSTFLKANLKNVFWRFILWCCSRIKRWTHRTPDTGVLWTLDEPHRLHNLAICLQEEEGKVSFLYFPLNAFTRVLPWLRWLLCNLSLRSHGGQLKQFLANINLTLSTGVAEGNAITVFHDNPSKRDISFKGEARIRR